MESLKNRSELAAARRAKVLAAAAVVISKVGFERMRLHDVAMEADVSIGLLQYYFETRERLGAEAFAFVCGERARRFADAADTKEAPWDQIQASLRYALDPRGMPRRSATWIDLCAAASRDAELRGEAGRVQDAWRAPLLTAISAGVESGDLHPVVSAEAAVDALLAMIDGAILGAAIGDQSTIQHALENTLLVARQLLGVGDTADS